MDDVTKTKGILESLPELLYRYSGQSYVVLGVLLVAAATMLTWNYVKRRARQPGLPPGGLFAAGALLFLSLGGGVLRWSGARDARAKQAAAEAETRARVQRFIASHRAGDGERRLMISDFTLPTGGDEGRRRVLAERIRLQVPLISQILNEELPEEFAQPLVVHLPTAGGPWEAGIREDNVQAVLRELRGFELVWGDVLPDGKRAKTFLGVPRDLAGELDTVIPLRDVSFEDDPAAEYFREGRQRLLGQVMLGIALDNYRRAGAASGGEKKALLLKGVSQLQRARQALSSFSNDPILRRNLFSQKVDLLIKSALEQAQLGPQ